MFQYALQCTWADVIVAIPRDGDEASMSDLFGLPGEVDLLSFNRCFLRLIDDSDAILMSIPP